MLEEEILPLHSILILKMKIKILFIILGVALMWYGVNILYTYEVPMNVIVEGKSSACNGSHILMVSPIGENHMRKIFVTSSTYNRCKEGDVISVNTPHQLRDVIVGWIAIMVSFVAFVYIAEKSQ